MNRTKSLKEFLSQRYYQQAGAAVPVFITPAAFSGIEMKKSMGLGYTGWVFRFKDNFAHMLYSYADLERLWRTIYKNIKRNKSYLQSIKKDWRKRFKRELSAVRSGAKNIRKMNDQELLDFLRRSCELNTCAVGTGHVIEAISIIGEDAFKAKLKKFVTDTTRFNFYFSALTAPSAPSFLSKEENDLFKIKHARKLKLSLEAHLKKYFWLQNNYAGSNKLDTKFFEKRLKKLKIKNQKQNPKRKLINEIKLDKETAELSRALDFTTVWQDERKAATQEVIAYLDLALQEAAQRAGVSHKDLYYLSVHEVKSLRSLEELKHLAPLMKKRNAGSYIFLRADKQPFLTGKDFADLEIFRQQKETKKVSGEIRGSIANPGTVIGTVRVCDTLDSLKKVRQGEVLVASMTRPEYMIAIKKASAIVTDEGGITSHAAIVSRELNIPCIIGTKVATRVLKTGDKVEVRANHGVVRIIN